MSKHTPTPWKVRQAYLNGEPCNYTIHTGMTTIADCSYDEQGEAEAKHIVKCVNAHDELVAALKNALHYLAIESEALCDEGNALLAKLEGGAS